MGNLFILHPELRPALLKVRAQCEANCENKLMAAIDPGTTYTLEEFKTCHIAKMGLVGNYINLLTTVNYSLLYTVEPLLKEISKIRTPCFIRTLD